MKRLLLAVLICAVPVLASGNLCVSQTSGNYNWSNSAAWTNCGSTVPGDGDYVVWKSTGTLTIDQNIGTSGGGGVKWIRQEDGTIVVNAAAARTITFGSTGTDPIGSGTDPNPGKDATMHGFFVAKGLLDLEGTSIYPVTITTANDSSPTYIRHRFGDYRGCTTFTGNVCNGSAGYVIANLKLRYTAVRHVGVNLDGYYGIDWRAVDPSGNVDIQYCSFVDPYVPLWLTGDNSTSTETFAHNSISGNGGDSSVRSSISGSGPPYVFTDNTETDATVAGWFFYTTAHIPGVNISRNAIYGNVANRGLLLTVDDTGSGHIIQDNMCASSERAVNIDTVVCLRHQSASSDTTSVISGNISLGLWQGFALYTGTPAVQYNWLSQYTEAANGQGNIITYGNGGVTFAMDHNVLANENGDTNILTLAPTNGANTNVLQADHMTYAVTGTSSGILLGEGNSGNGGLANSWLRSSLFLNGGYQVYDGNTHNTWANSYNGAGVHHNLTYGSATPYSTVQSTGFDNGTTHHPNALYGDLTANPGLADPSRRLTRFDLELGGAGTYANLFTQLAKRCGLNGTYDSRYDILSMRNWLFAGYAPRNLSVATAGHDGSYIGAVAPILMFGVINQ